MQTLAMEPPGSSPWMEPLEPELEAAMLNHCAGEADPGGGLIRAIAPCPTGARRGQRQAPPAVTRLQRRQPCSRAHRPRGIGLKRPPATFPLKDRPSSGCSGKRVRTMAIITGT